MLINLKPHLGLSDKMKPYGEDLCDILRVGGGIDAGDLLVGVSALLPRNLFEEVSMYVMSHQEVTPAQVPEFSGTEFTMQIEADEFVMVTIGGTVVGMSHLEAKQLAAWILEN